MPKDSYWNREREKRPYDGPENDDTPTCPKCRAAMRLRNGPTGQFYGCSKFPDCHGTRQA